MKAVCIALAIAAAFRACSVAAIVCTKSPGIIYTWDESSNPLGPSRCSNDCECAGTRTCSSLGFCESAPPPPPRPPSPPTPQPSPPAPPAPPPPVATTVLSRYFCGATWSSSATSPSQAVPSNNPYRNISGYDYESDAVPARSGNPLLSITIRASIISIYEAWSTYRDLGRGPLHSAWNNTDPVYTLNLTSAWSPTSPDKIEAVSACCYKSSTAGRPVTPYRLLFRTQSGVVHRLGRASTDPGLCDTGDVNQPWDNVEPGHLLAGLVTETDRDWSIAFSRIAFVFVRIPGFSDVVLSKPPLPPLPPSNSYGSVSTATAPSGSGLIATGGSSSSRSGSSSSSSSSGGTSSSTGIIIGVVVGVAVLLAGAVFGFVLLKKRARRRYGSDVAFDGASCSFYPRHGASPGEAAATPPPPQPPPPYGYPPYQQYPSSFAAAGAAPYYPPPPTSPAGLGRSASGPAPTPRFMPSLQRQGTLSNSIALQLQVLFGENAVINIRPGAAPPPTVTIEEVPASPPPQPQTYGAEELAAATSGFAPSQLLARLPAPVRGVTCAGGSVYAGRLAGAAVGDGARQIAVWQVDDAPSAAVVAVPAEASAPAAVQLPAGVVRRLAALRHPHLLPLLGDCPEKMLLVYELAASGAGYAAAAAPGTTAGPAPFASLADRLLAQPPPQLGDGSGATALNGAATSMPPALPVLGWRDRVRIGYEVAAAVALLHSQRPPLFCRVPLDAARVVVDTASGSARLGFVALGGASGGNDTPEVRAEAAAEDVRALGVLLLRLLTGDATGGAAALEARVHSARQADTAGGGGGRALTSLVFDGAGGERWPAAEALAFANAALRCCSASATSGGGGSMGGSGIPDLAAAAPAAAGGGPDLQEVVLPYLLQLSNRTRLYASAQQQQHHQPHAAAAAPAGSATAADAHPAGANGSSNGGATPAAGNGGNAAESASLPDDIPPLFLCPITQDLMEDPVVAADGFSYERVAIEQWIASSAAAGRAPRSPMTNLAFEHKSLVPNRVLKSQIAAWREEQQAAAAT